jgi:hypothetical protein
LSSQRDPHSFLKDSVCRSEINELTSHELQGEVWQKKAGRKTQKGFVHVKGNPNLDCKFQLQKETLHLVI